MTARLAAYTAALVMLLLIQATTPTTTTGKPIGTRGGGGWGGGGAVNTRRELFSAEDIIRIVEGVSEVVKKKHGEPKQQGPLLDDNGDVHFGTHMEAATYSPHAPAAAGVAPEVTSSSAPSYSSFSSPPWNVRPTDESSLEEQPGEAASFGSSAPSTRSEPRGGDGGSTGEPTASVAPPSNRHQYDDAETPRAETELIGQAAAQEQEEKEAGKGGKGGKGGRGWKEATKEGGKNSQPGERGWLAGKKWSPSPEQSSSVSLTQLGKFVSSFFRNPDFDEEPITPYLLDPLAAESSSSPPRVREGDSYYYSAIRGDSQRERSSPLTTGTHDNNDIRYNYDELQAANNRQKLEQTYHRESAHQQYYQPLRQPEQYVPQQQHLQQNKLPQNKQQRKQQLREQRVPPQHPGPQLQGYLSSQSSLQEEWRQGRSPLDEYNEVVKQQRQQQHRPIDAGFAILGSGGESSSLSSMPSLSSSMSSSLSPSEKEEEEDDTFHSAAAAHSSAKPTTQGFAFLEALRREELLDE
eukprot:GHVU01124434.1.p1 GENE.GHVU01124434.1~~GHVU01124434.1.p1  ORF type:complete len:522 (+),score=134.09 GHVU01124434.1:357-1922(+)